MNKTEFLNELQRRLAALPEEDAKRTLDYYSEMIDDRIEDGMSEYEATAALGSMDDIISGAIADIPLKRIVNARVQKKREIKTWHILLIVLLSPLWMPLLIVAFALLIAAVAVVGSLFIAAVAVVIGFGGATIRLLIEGFTALFTAGFAAGLLMIGLALLLAGLAVLIALLFKHLAALAIYLIKLLVLGIKTLLVGKEK